jgi:hypothetical protein
MEGRHVVSSINLVAWNGTGCGVGVAEPECGFLQPHHFVVTSEIFGFYSSLWPKQQRWR